MVNYVGAREPADEVAATATEAGASAVALEADIADEPAVQQLFAQAAEALGGHVDLLVNNAGVEAPYPLEELPLEEWQRVLAVNLTGPFLCSREMVRALPPGRSEPPASVINVSSVHEVIPWRSFSHYCASKGGLKLFGETIAVELAPRGVRVASVAPGAIRTPINQELLEDEEKRREQEEQIAWGRLGEPEEVAGAISWLASSEAEYVTGTTLFVDGGMTRYPNFV